MISRRHCFRGEVDDDDGDHGRKAAVFMGGRGEIYLFLCNRLLALGRMMGGCIVER